MQNFLKINEIRKMVYQLSEKINMPKPIGTYLTYCYPIGDATPNIEVDDRGYHYVISERGSEYERRITQDIDELLYWIFKGVTFNIALNLCNSTLLKYKWEQRRIIFKIQQKLLSTLNHVYEERFRKEIYELLKKVPFDDGFPNTLDYGDDEDLSKESNGMVLNSDIGYSSYDCLP